ncbi:MAG: FAD-binding oxidoreductase, partial [Acidimicrobiales bacterium]
CAHFTLAERLIALEGVAFDRPDLTRSVRTRSTRHNTPNMRPENVIQGSAQLSTSTNEQLRDALIDIVGSDAVVSPPDPSLLTDFRRVFEGEALLVVRPANPHEVADVVACCASHQTPIVTQGGNTGLSGGAIPTADHPSVLLSMSRMNNIESIDVDRSTMTVEAGVTISAVQEAATSVGRLFAPDWGARGSATVGGAVATNAGGNNVLRYGNMREQVLGLEVVLPDGCIWDGLRTLRKDSSGYDLKQLFIGSEGTLGVVTRAVVKLRPATPHQQSALATMTDLTGLMAMYDLAQSISMGTLTAFELMPEVALARACDVYDIPRPLGVDGEFYVLVKVACSQPIDDLLAEMLSAWADASLIVDGVVAATPEQEARLWRIRDELTPARIYPQTQAVGVKLDIAVPIDSIPDFHDSVQTIAAEIVPDALAYGFGHVGDGNLHMMVLPLDVADIRDFEKRVPSLVGRIDETTFEFGGTLSAEHGIGRLLNERVRAQKSELEWELMRSVKDSLDPHGLMNPGALFSPRDR